MRVTKDRRKKSKIQGRNGGREEYFPCWQKPGHLEATVQGESSDLAPTAGALTFLPFRVPFCEGSYKSQGLALHTPLASDSLLQVLSVPSAISPDSLSSPTR